MTYTVSNVGESRQFETKFGMMVSYKVKFAEDERTVEITQKPTSPAPTIGQTMDGHIEDGQYGAKFKKEYNQGGNFTQASSSSSSTGYSSSRSQSGGAKRESDPFTMYLSYAKDVAVAMAGSMEGFDQKKYEEILADVVRGGKYLYNNRPGAAPEAPATAQVKETMGGGEDIPKDLLDSIPF